MNTMRSVGMVVVMMLAATAVLAADEKGKKATFDSKEALAGWTTSGDVTVDAEKNREGQGGGAMKVGRGGKAVWKLGEANVSGQVEFWVFEDGTVPADPKASGVGATWGLVGADGKAVIVGALYASYLAGDSSYAAGDYDSTDKTDGPNRKVQFLGLKRGPGWHKWTFAMDAQKGLKILYDGKDVNGRRQRFNWNKTRLGGIAAVIFAGDATKDGKQVLWVDDLTVALGEPMTGKPVPPDPAAAAAPGAAPVASSVLPAADPAPEKPVQLTNTVKGKHPRLLFTAEDLPRLKAYAQGEGKPFFDQLVDYLGVSHAPETPTATDATDAQRQGLWRAPTVAVHYALTGDKKSFENAKGMLEWMVKQEHWETGKETDSGMAAANIAVGAGILYDVLYNDLDPAFRETARQKLLLQARRQWYLGHLNGNHAVGYWQGDPQNNHRWHRDAGFAMCALGVAGDGPGDEFIVSKLAEELAFVAKWLPDDATSHESPSYWVFGSPHLTLAIGAADRCLGTKYLDLPYFKNVPMFRMQTLCPGLKKVFGYGDFGGTGGINGFTFLSTSHHKLADLQDGLMKFYAAQTTAGADGKRSNPAFQFGWTSLVWSSGDVKGGSIEKLPQTYYFDDLGLVMARDGWQEKNVAMMFKCAPYGGYKLNQYRKEKGGGNVNVAHDDPDVNQFQIFADGAIVVRDDGYSDKKLTSGHNTILVNGAGQRGEGGVWMQPLKNFDMTRLGVMTAFKDAGNVVVAEGEGAGAYPALNRYRRAVIWVKGGYVLVLDDIRGTKANEITWLVQGDGLEAVDAAAGRYKLTSDKAACEFAVTADTPLASTIGVSTADHRGKNMGLKQLQAKATAQTLRVAAVFDPWKGGKLKVEIKASDADHAVVTVTGGDFVDTWTWEAAPAMSYTPATLKGQRAGGFTVEVGPADKARIPLAELPAMQPAEGQGGAARPARRAGGGAAAGAGGGAGGRRNNRTNTAPAAE